MYVMQYLQEENVTLSMVFSTIFMIIGFLFAGLGIAVWVIPNPSADDIVGEGKVTEKTEGEIWEATIVFTTEDKESIAFQVSNRWEEVSQSFDVGDTLKIKYDPAEPAETVRLFRPNTGGASDTGIAFIVLGGIAFLVGSFLLISRFNFFQLRKLKTKGIKQQGTIKAIKSHAIIYKGSKQYFMQVQVQDPHLQKSITLNSPRLFPKAISIQQARKDISKQLTIFRGAPVDVYFHQNKSNKFYIDFSSIPPVEAKQTVGT